MKENELRIGNWVDYSGSIIPVASIYIGQSTLEYADPIPLTPEILEKAGFEWSIYHQAFHKENFEFDINECFPKGYSLSTFKRRFLIVSKIKYLHQLQNLYYALTGEELEIKL